MTVTGQGLQFGGFHKFVTNEVMQEFMYYLVMGHNNMETIRIGSRIGETLIYC